MLEFITTNLPMVICLVVGIGLLVLEVFMPGFGVAGVSGILLEIVAVVLTYVNYGPWAAAVVLVIALFIIALAVSVSLRSAANGKLSKSEMILRDTESEEAGYRAAEDMKVFLGREGTTVTILRPTGMAEFDGVRLNVLSDGEFIPQGTKVRIERVEGSRILVRPCGDVNPAAENKEVMA